MKVKNDQSDTDEDSNADTKFISKPVFKSIFLVADLLHCDKRFYTIYHMFDTVEIRSGFLNKIDTINPTKQAFPSPLKASIHVYELIGRLLSDGYVFTQPPEKILHDFESRRVPFNESQRTIKSTKPTTKRVRKSTNKNNKRRKLNNDIYTFTKQEQDQYFKNTDFSSRDFKYLVPPNQPSWYYFFTKRLLLQEKVSILNNRSIEETGEGWNPQLLRTKSGESNTKRGNKKKRKALHSDEEEDEDDVE
jgi:hypothetical protein